MRVKVDQIAYCCVLTAWVKYLSCVCTSYNIIELFLKLIMECNVIDFQSKRVGLKLKFKFSYTKLYVHFKNPVISVCQNKNCLIFGNLFIHIL